MNNCLHLELKSVHVKCFHVKHNFLKYQQWVTKKYIIMRDTKISYGCCEDLRFSIIH